MLHVCVQKFDVTGNLENFWELNRALNGMESALHFFKKKNDSNVMKHWKWLSELPGVCV